MFCPSNIIKLGEWERRKCIGSSRRISLRSKEKTEDGWAKLGTTALEKAELGAF